MLTFLCICALCSDVVEMASYAPLFVHEKDRRYSLCLLVQTCSEFRYTNFLGMPGGRFLWCLVLPKLSLAIALQSDRPMLTRTTEFTSVDPTRSAGWLHHVYLEKWRA